MAEKYFKREEAEQLLPMIEENLGKALEEKKKVDALEEELAKAAARIMALGGSIPPSRALAKTRAQRDESASELAQVVEHIQQTGCVIKDLDIGLIDFPSLRNGQEVYLCWKLGEERIAYYHGVDEGFAGRKPLDNDSAEPDDEPPPGPTRIN